MRPVALALFVLTLLAGGSRVLAAPGAFVRFPGGGPARTDCMLMTDVAGASAQGRTARCTDGDPTCDLDGRPDGTCTFQLRLCLDVHDEGTASSCGPDIVTEATLTSATPPFSALAAALVATTMPAAAGRCTEPAPVPIALGTRRAARAVLRAAATMSSGHADRDRVKLVCRAVVVTNFATLQRRIITPSCATSSCHGAGQAGGLTLLPGQAYSNLVGVLATNPAARAAGLLRVVPGDPDASFLIRKLTGQLSPAEGESMPRVGSTLPRAQLDLVRRWIAAGATAEDPF